MVVQGLSSTQLILPSVTKALQKAGRKGKKRAPSASSPAPSLGIRPLVRSVVAGAGTHRDRKDRDGDPHSREGRGRALQPENKKATTILFFPGTLVAPGLTRPRDFLMLLVQHLGHVVLLLLLDPVVRHVIPATEPAGHGLGAV